MKKSASFIYGMSLSGIDLDRVNEAEAFEKVASTSPDLAKQVARLGAALFEVAGKSGSVEHIIFTKVAAEDWDEAYRPFVDSVITVLGRESLRKQAGMAKPLAWAKGLMPYMGGLSKTMLLNI